MAALRGAPPAPAELPFGFGIALGRDVRHYPRPDGGVLLGGSPLRVFRLKGEAWAAVAGLTDGSPVAGRRSAQVAARLVEAGLAASVPRPSSPGPHPAGPPGTTPVAAPPTEVQLAEVTMAEVTIVVPARDRPAGLRRCLASLGSAAAVVVVDDASREPEQLAEVVAAAGARLHVREHNGGPAAARNTGAARCETPLIAFVDSDCRPEPGWLARLLPHFDDPSVAAVAPRIIGADAPGWLGRYEASRSSLDLGTQPGAVAPRSRIAYVPAAALVVRRAALGAGFCEHLQVGEDVDLIWRMHAAGWRIQYEPAVRVRHEHRVRLRSWAARKFLYGTSAGPLARRHPGQVPPAVTSAVALLPLALLWNGRPAPALAAAGISAAGLARRLPSFPGRAAEAARLMSAGCVTTGYGLATAATRAWLPLTIGLLIGSPAFRRTIAGGVLVGPLVAWWTRRPALDPLRWTLAYLVEDACYCAGVWVGAVRAGTAAPLLPAVPESRWFRRQGGFS